VIYRFNQFSLDTEQYQLCLSEKPVAVEPLAFDLLVYLIEHRDRVVTREELLDNLWKGKVVTDTALGARLKDARKAVGDSGKKQDIIKTLHGRGYQFIAKISEHSESTVTANRSADGVETAALPDKPSIAVLPFTNMSNDPEQEFFSDGITEDIITALSRISSMLVIARNSTFIYKGKAVDVKQVGREQGVRYVLEGGVRKAGNRVRISAQLIDASTGQHRWAERYDRDLDDIFAVQDEITQKIVSELDVQLREGEQARLWSSGTVNFEAWECVRLGSDLLNSMRVDRIPEAMRLVKRAIDLDPEYAAAWVWLAWSHFHTADYGSAYSEEERKQALESTRDCAHQALEFDPSSADAYAALGLYHLSLSEHEAAIANINKSVQLAPNHAQNIAISAAILNKCGQPQKAIERIRKAMRLSPIYPSWNLSILGQAYRMAGMIDAAIETYSEIISTDTDSLDGHIALAEIFGETNQPDQAAVSAREVLRLNPDFTIEKYVDGLAYSDPAENLRFADGLRKAGLPE
jgi:TolB-like protein